MVTFANFEGEGHVSCVTREMSPFTGHMPVIGQYRSPDRPVGHETWEGEMQWLNTQHLCTTYIET